MIVGCQLRGFAIAPRHGGGSGVPDVEEELAAFANSIDLLPEIPLMDFVVDRDIAHEITQAGDCDLFLILAHADKDGVLLSDDTYLTTEAIGQYARAINAKTIYLNTCNSALFVNRLAIITSCSIIYTAGEVTDNEAIRFGILFAKALSVQGDIEAAFKLAAPRDRKYQCRLYKPQVKPMTVEEIRQFEQLRQSLSNTDHNLIGLQASLERLEGVITESNAATRMEIALLRQRNEYHEKSLDATARQIEALKDLTKSPSQNPLPTQAIPSKMIHIYGIAAFVFGLLIFLALLRLGQ